jgi:hypothetical protein
MDVAFSYAPPLHHPRFNRVATGTDLPKMAATRLRRLHDRGLGRCSDTWIRRLVAAMRNIGLGRLLNCLPVAVQSLAVLSPVALQLTAAGFLCAFLFAT